MQVDTARKSSIQPGRRSLLSVLSGALVLLVLFCTSPVLAFNTSVFSGADSYVKSGQPNKNQGGEAILRIQDSGNNRALMRFDQAAIAVAVGSGHLTQAKLRLNIYSNGNNWGTNGGAVAVHRLLQAWSELGVTWNCPDDTNTANSSSDCTPWVMNDSSRYPFLVTPTDVIAHTNNVTGPVEWDVTADVQAFLAGAAINYGWLVKKTDESAAGRVDYSSREGTVIPELVLSIDGPIPPAKPKLIDAFIRQGAPNKSLGSELYLRLEDSGNNRALVAFDQAKLEQEVGSQTLVSAKLRLSIIFNADNWGPGRDVAVHRMLRSWTEVGATWNCADDLNTENGSSDCPTNAWNMTHSANWPFNPTPTAAVLHSNGQLGTVEWDVTADVQAFLAGTAANYGWLVKKFDEGQSGRVEYSSREGDSPPRLVLELSSPPPPPPSPLVLTVESPTDGFSTAASSVTVSGLLQGPQGTIVAVNGQAASIIGGAFSVEVSLEYGTNILSVIASAPDGRATTQIVTVTRTGNPLPPDPTQVAPPLDLTAITSLAAATAFLYEGPDPIQTGVQPGTIETRRAAVIRGKVTAPDDSVLSSVTISVLGHPEYGQTLSRADGRLDLVVNGGSYLTITYTKDGYLPVQRQVYAPWQDYVSVPDVVMTPLDTQATVINLGDPTPIQVARGSVVSDQDGTRQATLLFRVGTTANMILPSGATQALSSLTVRATEYTVGPNGPKAMPAELPPTSGYTYAVEYSVDEALAAGAKSVQFSQPVYQYVDNFLNFPVGTVVPVAYYDRVKAAWAPSPNGRVIKILSITNSTADIDVNGSGNAADSTALAALDITLAERQQLASLYEAGKSLWRVPIPHFSAWDSNWGVGPPLDGTPPNLPPPGSPSVDKPDCQQGSIIECQSQTLRESVPITGTPFTLNYSSNRTNISAMSLPITLSGSILPSSLKRIELEVNVAGRQFTYSFSQPVSNQRFVFDWDGLDAYGRSVQGAQPVFIRIGYTYDGVYLSPATLSASFGYNGGGILSGNPARTEITMWQASTAQIGNWGAFAVGLGGWTLSEHHAYDSRTQILYLGDGRIRSEAALSTIVTTAAGNGSNISAPDGTPATAGGLNDPYGIAVDSQGNLYITEPRHHWIRKVTLDGIITTIAGNSSGGFSGDGGPAVQALFTFPGQLAMGADDSLYVLDSGNARIRRISKDGIVTTVAGNGQRPSSGDGGLATSAGMNPSALAVDGQGNIYIADTNTAGNDCRCVRKVAPNGIINAVAGNGQSFFSNAYDGVPATAAPVGFVRGLAADAQGNLYISNTNQLVLKVGPDGILTRFAGSMSGSSPYPGDGNLARDVLLFEPHGLAVDDTGNLYIGEVSQHRVRKVTTDARISTVAGKGIPGFGGSGPWFSGDNGPSTAAMIACPIQVALNGQGDLYVTDGCFRNNRVRKVSSVLPESGLNSYLLTSEDGSQLYHFDASGRHQSTVSTLTGAQLFAFVYDPNGHLSQITDGDGNVTRVERDSAGVPSALLAPDGQRTPLSLDANDYLASITNPANETTLMEYDASGLLTTFTNARTQTSTITYDSSGRLLREQNAVGGFWNITRTDINTSDFEVSMTSALGRANRYKVEKLAAGDTRRTNTKPDGTLVTTLQKTDGTTQITAADGTVITEVSGPDPRFGMQAPLTTSASTTLPSGLTRNRSTARQTILSDPSNFLSLVSQTDTVTQNGKTTTTVYDATTRQYVNTMSTGRQSFTVIDAQGRPTQTQVSGLDPVAYDYDLRGRLAIITQGSGAEMRQTSLNYNPQGFLNSITDALGRNQLYSYDLAGRVTQQTLPDGRVIQFAYDANGNVTSITPPGQPAHAFSYTPVDLEAQYTPPAAGIATPATQYAYNLDKQLTQITRPDGQTVSFSYNSGGRLSGITLPNGTITYAYNPTTGQLQTLTAPDNSTVSYAYDGALVTGETWAGAVNGTVTRNYNSDFNATGIGVNGNNVTIGYDGDQLLTQAGSLTISRDSNHGLITGTNLGAVTTARTYNSFGEMTQFTASQNGNGVFDVQYTRDKLGRVTQKVETVSGQTDTYVYTYDQAGRLTDVNKNGSLYAHYDYDANSNRIGTSGAVGNVTGSYDQQDRLLSYGNNSYAYTDNGELKSKTFNGQTTSYVYDVLGNLRQATLPNSTTIEYIIDGRNRRIGKKVNGTLTRGWLYLGQLNPIAELDGSNNVVIRFVYGSRPNVPDYMIKGTDTYRIISDNLGSPRLIVNIGDGTVVQRIDYDEFGNITTDTNPGFQPFGFAGGLYDRETKLTRFGALDYDPEVGRYTGKDPIGFGGGNANLYGYVGNDPVNFFDLDGFAKTSIDAAIEQAVLRGDINQLRFLLEDVANISKAESEALLKRCAQNLPDKISKIASQTGRSQKEIAKAIEQVKQQGLPKGTGVRNPDVRVDPRTGEVYPKTPEGGVGDSIGNIFDHLK